MTGIKQACKNMTAANKFISNILINYNEDELIKNKHIIELIKYHPTKQLDINNIDWLKMKSRPPFNKLALFYKYKNNINEDDISWKLCIRNLYNKYIRNEEFIKDVKSALRNESHFGSKKQYFKDNAYYNNDKYNGKCNNCKIITTDITTDHYPTTYLEIFDDFINENSIKLSNINIFENNNCEIRMEDNDLASKWRDYHDNKAKYRLLCKSCNSRFGCYDYKKNINYKK